MSELLIKDPEMLLPSKQAVRSEIASRAVALCEGCPMAKLCASKNTGKCPPPEIKQQMLESIDIGDGGQIRLLCRIANSFSTTLYRASWHN